MTRRQSFARERLACRTINSVAKAKANEMTARVMCTTRNPTACVWSMAMLRTSTAHTHIDQAAESRSIQAPDLLIGLDTTGGWWPRDAGVDDAPVRLARCI